jgi:hypothetical protein
LFIIKVFLNVIKVKLRLKWARLKLFEVLKKAELKELILNLNIIKRLFVIQVNKSGKKYKVYVILKARLDDNNISLEKTGYKCLCLFKLRRHK